MNRAGIVLGYVKLPLTEAAIERVRQEGAILDRLSIWPAVRSHVPRVLYSGPWGDSYLLFQSSLGGDPGPAEFTSIYEGFLQTLWSAHSVEKPGIALAREVAIQWENVVRRLDTRLQSLGQTALSYAHRLLEGATIRCGISHGDFAPWNTRVVRGQLSVFDWESAQFDTPNAYDVWNFHLKTGFLLKKKTSGSWLRSVTPGGRKCFALFLLRFLCQAVEELRCNPEDSKEEAERFNRCASYVRDLLVSEMVE
jgi:hypothetical protein